MIFKIAFSKYYLMMEIWMKRQVDTWICLHICRNSKRDASIRALKGCCATSIPVSRLWIGFTSWQNWKRICCSNSIKSQPSVVIKRKKAANFISNFYHKCHNSLQYLKWLFLKVWNSNSRYIASSPCPIF